MKVPQVKTFQKSFLHFHDLAQGICASQAHLLHKDSCIKTMWIQAAKGSALVRTADLSAGLLGNSI